MCVPVFVSVRVRGDLGNMPMGGLVGGRVGRISYSVRHNYWSLDANKGRAKEDLECVCVHACVSVYVHPFPSSPPAVL